MRKNKIIISFLFVALLSCNKKKPNVESLITEVSIKKASIIQDEQITIYEIKTFFGQLKNNCEVSNQLTSSVEKEYPKFCEMIVIILSQKEGEIEYEIIKNKKGVISINSVEIIEDDGNKYRNEYSTFLYIVKKNNELIIDEIGGAG